MTDKIVVPSPYASASEFKEIHAWAENLARGATKFHGDKDDFTLRWSQEEKKWLVQYYPAKDGGLVFEYICPQGRTHHPQLVVNMPTYEIREINGGKYALVMRCQNKCRSVLEKEDQLLSSALIPFAVNKFGMAHLRPPPEAIIQAKRKNVTVEAGTIVDKPGRAVKLPKKTDTRSSSPDTPLMALPVMTSPLPVPTPARVSEADAFIATYLSLKDENELLKKQLSEAKQELEVSKATMAKQGEVAKLYEAQQAALDQLWDLIEKARAKRQSENVLVTQ